MRYAMMLVVAAAVTASGAEPAKDAGAKGLYAKKCASCHAADGKGKASMAKMFKAKLEALDLTSDEVAKKSDADLLKILVEGKNKMPAFKGKLKEAEMTGLLAHIRTLAAKPEAKPAAK